MLHARSIPVRILNQPGQPTNRLRVCEARVALRLWQSPEQSGSERGVCPAALQPGVAEAGLGDVAEAAPAPAPISEPLPENGFTDDFLVRRTLED